jgi:hypothetical protein
MLFGILAFHVCTFVTTALFYLHMNMDMYSTVLTCIISAPGCVCILLWEGGLVVSDYKICNPKNLPYYNILHAIHILGILWLSIYDSQK